MWSYLFSWFLIAFATPSRLAFFGPVAAFAGYALFWRSIEGKRARFLTAFVWFFGVQLIHLSWVATTTYNGPLMWALYLFLVISEAIIFAFLNKFLSPLGVAGGWTLIEWGRQFFLCGFPFAPVGQALGTSLVGMQAAALFGGLGLTFVVLLTNALLLRNWRWGMAVGLVPYIIGGALLLHGSETSRSIQVALVEPKIAPPVHGNHPKEWKTPASPYENWEAYFPALQALHKKAPELIGFPEGGFINLGDIDCMEFAWIDEKLRALLGESVVEHYPDHDKWVSHAFVMQALAGFFNADIIAGMMCQVPGGVVNGAVHFAPKRAHMVYGKRRLLPIAEAMPFKWCRWIGADFGIFDSFAAGAGPLVFESRFGRICPSVCYEETFSKWSLESAMLKSDLLFNVTNDGWYPRSYLEKEQEALAQLRAVETGRTSLRACNTGKSGGFDATGAPLASKKVGDVIFVEAPLSVRQTFYPSVGDLPIVGLALLACALGFRRKKAPLLKKV